MNFHDQVHAKDGFWHYIVVRLPRTGDELYDTIEPFAEAVKGYLQIAIGIAVLVILIYQWIENRSQPLLVLSDRALTLTGGGLAISAAVELAYTFFTKGPDEALDPLILGISSFGLINISRHDPPLDNAHAVPVLLVSAALTILFIARRFLLGAKGKETAKSADDARPTSSQLQSEINANGHSGKLRFRRIARSHARR